MTSSTERDTLTRLRSHLQRVAKRLSDDIESATEKHSGTPEAVANAREKALREVMKRYFPSPFKVSKGGIYDAFGRRSASFDCVICAANHPYLVDETGEIDIILVDGVFAALELKPDLTDLPVDFGSSRKSDPEIVRALNQAKSVKSLERVGNPFIRGEPSAEKRAYVKGCPTYVISDHSVPISQLGKYIADYYLCRAIPPDLQLDVLFVLKSGLILNNKCPDCSLTKPTDNSWRPHLACYEGTGDYVTLFFSRLVSEIGPEMTISEPVLKRYFDRLFERDGIPKPVSAFLTAYK